MLREIDAAARLEAPHEAPALDLGAARWAAALLYRACQTFADRTVDAATVQRDLDPRAGPRDDGASTHWSVDLTLRYLPDLAILARALAPGDPLLGALQMLGARWPLASVGMPLGDAVARTLPDCLRDHACLRALYLDRILAHGDVGRLSAPWLVELAASALGGHPELAHAVAGITAGGSTPSQADHG